MMPVTSEKIEFKKYLELKVDIINISFKKLLRILKGFRRIE